MGRLRTRVQRRLGKLHTLIEWVDKEAGIAADEAWKEEQRSCLRKVLEQLSSTQASMLLRAERFNNLPTLKNKTFYGREPELQRLEDQLNPSSPLEKLSTACLCGLGGVGKSQIALEFAHRFIDDFNSILWISAETSLKLEESFGNIAHSLGIANDATQNANQLRELLKQWLLTNSRKGIEQGIYP